MELTRLLLEWYADHKRDLPWRKDKDAYRVWVSEIMLQQTRVEAVKPYYERWMERFPQLTDLAAASEEEVLRYWQGLGYYSRARSLWRGVKEVAAAYAGQVPTDITAMEDLPGVGEYTAGAVLSIAYNQRVSAIDGNVLRIFARVFRLTEDIAGVKAKRSVRSLVEQLLPDDRPGDFNEALMDLGATICIPKNPRCTLCPLTSVCQAYGQEEQQLFPVRQKRQTVRRVSLAAAVVHDREKLLIRQRSPRGLLAGLWEFPAVEIPENADAPTALTAMLLADLGLRVQAGDILLTTEHVFTHRRWLLSFYACHIIGRETCDRPDTVRWIAKEELAGTLFAGPHRKMAAQLLAGTD